MCVRYCILPLYDEQYWIINLSGRRTTISKRVLARDTDKARGIFFEKYIEEKQVGNKPSGIAGNYKNRIINLLFLILSCFRVSINNVCNLLRKTINIK